MNKKQINGWGSCLVDLFDTDKSKSFETNLFISEEALRQAEQIAVDALWDRDITSGHFIWNETSAKVFGYPPVVTDTSANWWQEQIHPEDQERVVEGLHQMIDGESTLWWDEYRFLRSDGSYTHILDRGVVLRHPDGKASRMIGAMVDLTLRQQTRQCLRNAKNAVADIHQTKHDFLNNISQELRTPMTIIIASLELLSQSFPQSDPHHLFDMAKTSADHLKYLIDDLFNFSRLIIGKGNLAKTLFDVRACVEKTISSFYPKAEDKGLRLGCYISSDVPEIIYSSPDHIAQVLMNLLENAIKFTKLGNVTVKVRCVPGREKQLLFSIQDSGIGIPIEKRYLLFRDFRQLDSTLTRKYGGPGLGLAASKKLVELMGGVIWAESEVGKGSTFSFTLPLR